jgi:hypothetical protein
MDVLIYVVLTIVIVGMFLTMFFLLRFFASFSSLVFSANDLGRGRPLENAMTGGLGPMWRVWQDKGNTHPRQAFLKHLALFLGSFVATMGAALLVIHLNSKHCVFSMTSVSRDGTVTVVCPSGK